MEKTTAGSLFFGAFPFDRVHKATKDINVHFYIHDSDSSNLYQRVHVIYTNEFREPLETSKYLKIEFVPRSKHRQSRS
jgi:hypothetical protein